MRLREKRGKREREKEKIDRNHGKECKNIKRERPREKERDCVRDRGEMRGKEKNETER